MQIVKSNQSIRLSADNEHFIISNKLCNILEEEHPIRGDDSDHVVLDHNPGDIRLFIDYLRKFSEMHPGQNERNALGIVINLRKQISEEYDNCKRMLENRHYIWSFTHRTPFRKEITLWDQVLGNENVSPKSPFTLVGTKKLDDLHSQCEIWSILYSQVPVNVCKSLKLVGMNDLHNYFGYSDLFNFESFIQSHKLVRNELSTRRLLAQQSRKDTIVYRQIQMRKAYKKWESRMIDVLEEVELITIKREEKKVLKKVFEKIKSNKLLKDNDNSSSNNE